jgi:hypothetical protein
MLLDVRRFSVVVLVLAGLAFAGYATLVSHAQHPCLVTKTNSCAKYLHPGRK